MLFNSLEFIFLFLPMVWFIDRLLLKLDNTVYSKIFLVFASFVFYGYYNYKYIILLGLSILVNYGISLCFIKAQANCVREKIILSLGLLFNFGLLFYFKYFNFFIDNINFVFHSDIKIEKIVLPLGISFFTFQQVSFIIDRYKNKSCHYQFWDYSCFVSFFPQLVAGPIVLHSDFIPQIKDRKKEIDAEELFRGFALFIIGLAKKVLLADTLSLIANSVFDDWAVRTYYLDCLTGVLTAVIYLMELYFDFSGYSDMARGLGKIFGINLPINFDSPFLSESVGEFWNRWHKTLNYWLREYIYIPLGGNRKGIFKKCINILIVFLASGIWHGANWTFVIWGALQGIAVVFENIVKKRIPWKAIRIIFTDIYVSFCFVFFRADSVNTAIQMFKRTFTVSPGIHILRIGRNLDIAENFLITKVIQMKFPQYLDYFYLIFFIVFLMICIYFIVKPNSNKRVDDGKWTNIRIIRLSIVFIWTVISLSGVSTFLYFNF